MKIIPIDIRVCVRKDSNGIQMYCIKEVIFKFDNIEGELITIPYKCYEFDDEFFSLQIEHLQECLGKPIIDLDNFPNEII